MNPPLSDSAVRVLRAATGPAMQYETDSHRGSTLRSRVVHAREAQRLVSRGLLYRDDLPSGALAFGPTIRGSELLDVLKQIEMSDGTLPYGLRMRLHHLW